MIITMLEAEVEPGRTADLEQTYRAETGALPPEIVESFLVRDTADAARFRIVTIWTSREALEAMRASTEKPKGVRIFESVGAAPSLSILEVVAHLHS